MTTKTCGGQGECLDELTEVMKDVDEISDYSVERLSEALKENLHTREAFKEIAEAITEASMLINGESEGRTDTRELL